MTQPEVVFGNLSPVGIQIGDANNPAKSFGISKICAIQWTLRRAYIYTQYVHTLASPLRRYCISVVST